MSDARMCPDCGSTALTWGSAITGPQGVVDGRHRIAELSVLVFLGCDECSATVHSEPLDALLHRLSAASTDEPTAPADEPSAPEPASEPGPAHRVRIPSERIAYSVRPPVVIDTEDEDLERMQYERWVAELSAVARDDESLDDTLDRVIATRRRAARRRR